MSEGRALVRYVLATGTWAEDPRLRSVLRQEARVPGERTLSESLLESVSAATPGLALHACFPLARARHRIRLDKNGAFVLDGVADLDLASVWDGAGDGVARLWRRVSAGVEGQFTALRLDRRHRRAELVNDALGMGQAYWLADERGCLVSNSVRVLQALTGAAELDEEGASLFLATGWVGRDRTLAADIRVVPPGAHWTWRDGAPLPVMRTHYSVRELLEGARGVHRRGGVLRTEMGELCARVARLYNRFECTLTAGRDSRVLLSLLSEQGVPCTYYTDGLPDSFEVRISRQVAAAKGVPYRVREKSPRMLVPRWDEAVARLLWLTDGMVSLWQVADSLWEEESGPWPLTFWGVGGEIARAVYGSTRWYLTRKTPAFLTAHLARWVAHDGNGLLTPAAAEVARGYVGSFVGETLDAGVALDDVPDAFYAFERVRRWAGTNARKAAGHTDLFSPFCTRLFAEAAFALPPQLRYAEALHHGILAKDRALYGIPSNAGRWRTRVPWLVLLEQEWRTRVRARREQAAVLFDAAAFDPYSLLEAVLPAAREACLDAHDSLVWRLVDRAGFERATAAELTPAQRRPHALFLYQVLTLAAYERSLRALASPVLAALN